MCEPTQTLRDRRVAQVAPGACLGAGLLQWNTGGWFGSQLGCTLWIAVCGGVLAPLDAVLGAGLFGIALVANLIGYALWRQRASLAPHPAIQLLCLTALGAAVASFFLIDAAGLADEIERDFDGGLGLPLWGYLGIYPLLMLIFVLIDRRGPRPLPPSD